MALDSDGGSSGGFKIIRRSGKAMWKNRKPVIVILLSFLLPRYATLSASFFNIRILVDLLVDVLQMILDTPPTMYPEFILVIVGSRLIEFLLIFLGFLLSSLLSLTVIHTVDMGLREEELTLRNLMLVIRTKLKGVMVTKLYVYFLSLGYLCFSLWLILVVHLVGGLSEGSQFGGYLMAILSFLLYVYLEFVWSQGVVVSTVERGQKGLIAVGRSADVVQGRGALAFGVNFLVILVTGGVAFLYSYAVKSLQWEATGSLLFPVADFVFCGITIFMEVFTLAVCTVFYRECSSNPADELAVQENLIYNGVPSAAPFREVIA